MTREELEVLISAYIDEELSPEEKANVEVLVRRNAIAGEIKDDYMKVRRALQTCAKTLRGTVPENFSEHVLRAIDRSGNVRGQDARPASRGAEPYSSSSGTRGDFVRRSRRILGGSRILGNPRILAYPLLVFCAALLLSFFSFNRSPEDSSVAVHDPNGAATPHGGTLESQGNADRLDETTGLPPAPLGRVDDVKGEHAHAIPVSKNLLILCEIAKEKHDPAFFPNLFARHGIEGWTQRTGGATGSVYDAKIVKETLSVIVRELKEGGVKVRIKTVEKIVDDVPETDSSEPIKTRFQIETP